jgi:DNA invertase Pin-like site-specific DNA recombinase
MKRKAIGYIRTSNQDHGPEAQLQALRSSLGPETTLVKTFTDLAVASGQFRTGLQDALAYLETNQVDVLVVYSGDRLTRKITELRALLERLNSRGVSLHIATYPPASLKEGYPWTWCSWPWNA